MNQYRASASEPVAPTNENACIHRPLLLEAAIFDLDGTLVDSAREILSLLEDTMVAAGISRPACELGPHLIGPPLEEILDQICPSIDRALSASVIQNFRASYRVCTFTQSPLFPHVREQLEYLRGSGLRLFVATNKPRDISRRLLRYHGILEFFHDTVHVDSEPGTRLNKTGMLVRLMRVHGLKPRTTLVQGDSAGDMRGARACGMHGAAALYGYAPDAVLFREEPDICLPTMDWGTGTFRADGSPFRWKPAPWGTDRLPIIR